MKFFDAFRLSQNLYYKVTVCCYSVSSYVFLNLLFQYSEPSPLCRLEVTMILVEISINPIQDGCFGGCSWMGGAKRLPLPKICHTYPTMMKLGTVIPYVTHLSAFFERWSWFEFNNLGLALDTNKSQEVFGANSYVCRSYRRKTVRGPFWSPLS